MPRKLLAVTVAALAAYLASPSGLQTAEAPADGEIVVPAGNVAPEPPREPERPSLRRICACESAGDPGAEPRHYGPDGEVLRGRVNPDDVGMCQINTHYHLEDSAALGYDIFTPEGNWGYASYLFETQGAAPWSWSAACWRRGASVL